jgi:hypothetical protein
MEMRAVSLILFSSCKNLLGLAGKPETDIRHPI